MMQRKLLDALPLAGEVPAIHLERRATEASEDDSGGFKRAYTGPDGPGSTSCPHTPPSKLDVGIDTELTPGNIKLLGFDVTLSPRPSTKREKTYGDSLYTQAFETALDVVLHGESSLFSPEEHKIFELYRRMPYAARFLYVRLFLRKRGAWFRVQKIGYESDIADISAACDELKERQIPFATGGSDVIDLQELLALLTLEEIKAVGKDYNATGSNKEQLSQSLINLSKQQTGLRRSGSIGLNKTHLGGLERRSMIILNRIHAMLGPLIRLTDQTVALFHRLHIVFYRSSEYSEKSLTTLILARISRRNFPTYSIDRKCDIFASREALIEYEAALKLKFEIDEIMEFNTTKEGLVRVMQVFESIYEDWQLLVLQLQDQSEQLPASVNCERVYYSRRFTSGWIWTKLVYQGAHVLARRHEYAREHEVWTTLLNQKVFRIGKRGAWYDRKALIEQHYHPTYPAGEDGDIRRSKRMALQTCITGLQDPDTHQIYHNALQKRIVRLENELRLAKREKHDFSHIILRKPAQRTICGVRLDDRLTGKHSVWRGQDHADAEVSVEALCLEFYANLGWKGFHSENSIITTLFAMLFWDILFLPIPGVFQTEFQTAPLDLATDAFYPARASAINHRLVHIENGGYIELLENIDTQHREKETWCIGVRWSYTLEDLIEISTCLGGSALAQLCRLFAEEYGHRVGGVGDLCLWNPEKGQCMFVEVKGPGDRLSETQIAWLDQMAAAGIEVELCHVVESEADGTSQRDVKVKLERGDSNTSRKSTGRTSR